MSRLATILLVILLASTACSSHQSSVIRATAQDSIVRESAMQESARTDEVLTAISRADSVVVTRYMESEGTHIRAVIYNPSAGLERTTSEESSTLLGSRVEAVHQEQSQEQSQSDTEPAKPPALLVVLLCAALFALWIMANELLSKSANK